MMTMIGIDEVFVAFEAMCPTTLLDLPVVSDLPHLRLLRMRKEKLLKNKNSRKNEGKDFGTQDFSYLSL